jgi:endonuclease/exonuclease/phosphatase family metal-dependent hydrolase
MAPQGPGRVRSWRHDMRALSAAGGALLVLAGDFNATLDHAELRRPIGTGYEDAAEQVGAGLRPTWPVGGRRRLPVTIDHVLAGERAGVRRVATHTLPRTDHRAFVAELVLPAE